MLDLETALARILELIPSPKLESCSLWEAHERFIGQTVNSPIDLPRFDNSAMDGYAVRSADLVRATAVAPIRLRLGGRVAAGEGFAGEVAAGDCIRVFTGSPLPRGADAVVMQEDTRVLSEQSQQILILESAKPWENVRLQGEDVKCGAPLAEAGEVLTVGKLTLLGAAG